MLKPAVRRTGSIRASQAALADETVAVGEPFSNGGQWPGDPNLAGR